MFAKNFFFFSLDLIWLRFWSLAAFTKPTGGRLCLPPMFALLLLQLNRRQSWKNLKVPLLLSTVTYKELLYRKL